MYVCIHNLGSEQLSLLWSQKELSRLYTLLFLALFVIVLFFSKFAQKNVILSLACHEILPVDLSPFVLWQNGSMAAVLLHLE